MGNILSHIIGKRIFLNPRLLLLDCAYFGLQKYEILLANLLTAASLLLAKQWKSQEVPDLGGWMITVRFTCLMNKSALSLYRPGVEGVIRTFTLHRAVFIYSEYAIQTDRGKSLLTVM